MRNKRRDKSSREIWELRELKQRAEINIGKKWIERAERGFLPEEWRVRGRVERVSNGD